MTVSFLKTIILISCLMYSGFGYSQTIDVFLSPDGDDSNTGSIGMPKKTLGEALRFIQESPHRGILPIRILLRSGIYSIDQELLLDDTHSGSKVAEVLIASYLGEEVKIFGGDSVNSWSEVDGKPYLKSRIGHSSFRQFYVNGEKRIRAKSAKVIGIDFISSKKNGIILENNDLLMPQNPGRAELHMQSLWRDAYCPIDSVEQNDEHLLFYSSSLEEACSVDPLAATPLYSIPFTVENDIVFLDEPGEWYADPDNSVIYYYPFSWENKETLVGIFPVVQRLLTVKGSDKENPVEYIRFKGLDFEYGGWEEPNNLGWFGEQAGANIKPRNGVFGNVHIEYAKNISIEECQFRNLGGVGLNLENAVSKIDISCCLFERTGDAGVSVSTPAHFEIDLPNEDSCNYVGIRNCYFHKNGDESFGQPGLVAYYVKGLIVEHNEFFDLPYSAISVGWGWNSRPNSRTCMNNVIRYNKIGNILKVCEDGGGIYTLGQQPGSVMHENYLYKLFNNYAALYFDEGSSGYDVKKNVIETAPNWFIASFPSVNSITIDSTYTKVSNYMNNGTGISAGTVFSVKNDWPDDAKEIISNSGIETGCENRSILIDLSKNTPPIIEVETQFHSNLVENLSLHAEIFDSTDFLNFSEIKWIQQEGPGSITFTNRTGEETIASFSNSGRYRVIVQASDGLLFSQKETTIDVDSFYIGENHALDKNANASSYWQNDTHTPSGAVDGDINTIWHPQEGDIDSWWQIDLEEKVIVDRIELVTRQVAQQESTRRNFSIKASDDANFHFNDVLGFRGNDVLPYKGTYTLNYRQNRKGYRYIRVEKTALENFAIAEFRVFGKIDSPTSLDVEKNVSDAYPNPVKHYFFLNTKIPSELAIYNISGNLIYYSDNSLANHEVKVDHIRSGVYIWKLINNEYVDSGIMLKN